MFNLFHQTPWFMDGPINNFENKKSMALGTTWKSSKLGKKIVHIAKIFYISTTFSKLVGPVDHFFDKVYGGLSAWNLLIIMIKTIDFRPLVP